MTKQELEQYLQNLKDADYQPGTGFVITVDGKQRVFSVTEMAVEQERVNAEIKKLTPGIGAALGAVGEALTREAPSAAKVKQQQIAAGYEKLGRAEKKLVDTYTSALEKEVSTAKEVAAGSYKTEKDVANWHQKALDAEAALNNQGLFIQGSTIDPNGKISISVGRQKPGETITQGGPPPAVTGAPKGAVTENVRTAATTAASIGQMPKKKVVVTPTGTGAGTTTAGPAGPATSTPEGWVENQLELRGLPDTPANRKLVRKDYSKAKTALSADWKEKFIAKYPDMEYMLNENIFGPEVIGVIQQAVAEQWWQYPQTAKALIKRKLDATPYGINSNDKQEAFDKQSSADQISAIQGKVADLQKLYGRLDLSDADWQRLGYVAARNGEGDLLTQQKLFQEIYQRTPEGTMRYQTAVNMVENGKLGQDVNREYGRFLLKPSDDAIERYATGQLTLEGIRQEARAAAKYIFPALADVIDQGVDVKTVADQYASSAADILETTSSTINMMDPKFRVALDVRDGNTSRTMSLGEWQSLLKSDPTYGWQYTKTANQQAMDLSTTIARAFGKIQ